MEKESVKKFDLEAAFKALDEIDIPVAEKGIKANRVDLKERFNQKSAHETLIEDYYDVSSHEDLEEAQDEREAEVAQAKLARIEKIVDLDAESPDDLLPSYVGKVIIQCPQCMTLFYKNPEDIEHSEENPDVVNINEVCQHCGNTSGYNIIGKVGAVDESEVDNYTEEPAGEESELDLDFEEPTEEVDAEGTGEGAEEMSSDEELSDDELKELELDLEEIPEEEPEEEKKEESLNLSKEAPSDFETEYKSENLTLNEEATDESLNNSEIQKEAEEGSELKTENESENLTLNEEVDKDLDAKLKAHNDYIAYLQQMIKQEEEALKKAENDEIKAAIQRRLDAFNADLEAALPDAVKEEAPVEEEIPAEEPVEEAPVEEPVVEEEPAEEAPVEEQLTEDAAEEEKPAESNEIDYVEYKHSYCHALEPKLKAINYLVNVKKVEPKILKGYILKLLKDADIKWTEKEKEFKKNIEAKEDNYDILNYVKNSIEKAKTIKVKVDENGELVEGLNEGFEGCLYEVLTESLNKSEEAPSEHESENNSENLTLNESTESEIDSIIASWGTNESLTEENDLDRLLDSPEFETPVSEEEIDAARKEAAKENLTEALAPQAIIDRYNNAVANHYNELRDQENEEVADEWYDDWYELIDVKVYGEDYELTMNKNVASWDDAEQIAMYAFGHINEAAEEDGGLVQDDNEPVIMVNSNLLEGLKECNKPELSEDVADPEIDAIINSWEDAPEAPVEEACEGHDCKKELTEEASLIDEVDDPETAKILKHIKEYLDKFNLDDTVENQRKAIEACCSKEDKYRLANIRLKDGSFIVFAGLNEDLTEDKDCEDGECEKPLEECDKKPLKEEDEVPAEEAPVEEPVEGEEAVEEEQKEELPNVDFNTEEVKEVAEEAVEEVIKEAEAEVEPEVVEEKVEEVVADAVEEKVEAEEEAPVEGEEIPAEVEEPEFNEEDVDDLDECSLNKHIDEYLKEVYSNVKSFEATGCEFKDKKLFIEGKISFNSGKEKLTMFEFLPNYCEGKLFFEGYNKDFSEDKAFTLNCLINESKTLITESFGYKYKINENLVEGLK